MAGRIRTIKPEILDDEKTAHLSHLEWRLFVSLWMIADDYGNLRADPSYVRGQALWGTPDTTLESVGDALDRLARVRLVTKYRVRDQMYLHITTWDRHQKVDKPGKPRMPGPHEAEAMGDQLLMPFSRDSRETLATDLRPPTSDRDPGASRDSREPTGGRTAQVPIVPFTVGPRRSAQGADAIDRQLERIRILRDEGEADNEPEAGGGVR